MRSVRLQLLVTFIATAVAAGMLLHRGPPPSMDLFDAAYYGDTAQVLRHIQWGSDLDQAFPVFYGRDAPIAITPLYMAWDSRQPEMIEFLYAHGSREYGIRWRHNRAWWWLLPRELNKAAKGQVRVGPHNNTMWPRNAARSIVGWLSDRQVAVLRVEVFLPGARFGDETLGPLGRCVTPRRLDGERWADFVERVNAGAAEYIHSFTWAEKDTGLRDREPYFAFLLISRMEYESPLPGDLDVE